MSVRFLFVFSIFASSCTPPRSITQSGKVTPHKQFRVGYDFSVNIPTLLYTTAYNSTNSIMDKLVKQGSNNLIDSLNIDLLNTIAISYALDPFGTGSNLYARYGLLKRVDVGYKRFSGANVFDVAYQFLGSTGTMDHPTGKVFNGSIGIQYSKQEYELPSALNLLQVQKLLGFEFTRRDLLFPLVFSVSFGEEEKVGHFAFGMVYSRTFYKYGFTPENLYTIANTTTPVKPIGGESSYGAMGFFLNTRLGYKYAYLVLSTTLYYQRYGTFKLLQGSETEALSGVTFVPSLGLQLNPMQVYYDIKKKKNLEKINGKVDESKNK